MDGNLFEAKVTLELENDFLLKKKHFFPMDKLTTKIRGNSFLAYIPQKLKKKKRFSLEVYGGFSMLNPKDLNLRSDHQDEYGDFWGDRCLDFYKRTGGITAYTKTGEGEYERIRHAIPIGFKVKYDLNNSFSLSLGFEYFGKDAETNIERHFTYFEKNGSSTFYNNQVKPYRLWVRGYVPTLGIHFKKRISRLLSLEGSMGVGPVFAKCGYSLDNEEIEVYGGTLLVRDPDYELQFLKESGSGTGISLNVGVQLKMEISSTLGVFVEAGYLYQRVKNISGSGSDEYNNELKEWEGKWGIKEKFYEQEWGTLLSRWPSNSWDGDAINMWARDFELDLSGFRFKVGINFRFL